jgi:hypothetical protein
MLSGYHRNATLRKNHIAWTGGTAFAGWGRTDEMSDNGIHGYDATGGEFPQYTLLDGNVMRETGIWEKQSSCWFQVHPPLITLRATHHSPYPSCWPHTSLPVPLVLAPG